MDGRLGRPLLHLDFAAAALGRAALDHRIAERGDQAPSGPQTATVIGLFHSERPRHSRAAPFDPLDGQSGNQSQQAFGRRRSVHRAGMAGQMVTDRDVDRFQVQLQVAGLVEFPEVGAGIHRVLSNQLGIVVVTQVPILVRQTEGGPSRRLQIHWTVCNFHKVCFQSFAQAEGGPSRYLQIQ